MHPINDYPEFHETARSDKNIATAARYPTEIEDICEWVTTKQKRARGAQLQSDGPKEAETDVISDAPYRHIADPYEMRVLKIHPGNFSNSLKGTLHHCSLEYKKESKRPTNVYDLHGHWRTDYALSSEDLNQPTWYTALSYTWGEPDPTTDAVIECGGNKIKITHSLETALRHFRQKDHSINMWVDQICINQSNNKEKEQQIPLMSKIYGQAASTVIWLGEATEGSVEAFELLKRLGIFFDGCDSSIPPEDFERVFFCSAKDHRWKHLWDLVNRRWFTRLWIIQEVILSGNAWIVCGETELHWEYFVRCLSGLFYSDLFDWLQHTHGETDSDHQFVG